MSTRGQALDPVRPSRSRASRGRPALAKPNNSAVLADIQAMIDALAELVALVSSDGSILAVNEQWQHAVDRQQALGFNVGCDYAVALRDLIGAGDVRLQPILHDFLEVCAGKRQDFHCVYIGAGILSGHDYNMHFSRVEVSGNNCVLISAADLTEVNALKRKHRRVGSQVLSAQEGERRRIARELHDSTAQLLVVLQLNLTSLGRVIDQHTSQALIDECKNVLDEVHREIRNLSFMAHPPSLASNGLGKALEILVAGFASRTGLDIDLQMSDLHGASAAVETAVYRLAQEALANVHRHSSANHATVRLVGTMRCLHLIISDDGIGFDPAEANTARSIGVGVFGMAERVRELGGRFSMHRSPPKGTILRASLPRSERPQ